MHLNLIEASLGAALALAAALVGLSDYTSSNRLVAIADTVEVGAVRIDYPRPGEFLAAGRAVAAPVEQITVSAFRIMKQQVSSAEYDRCVAARACKPADVPAIEAADVPVAGVSYLDATAYADWYSGETGYVWRLPTAEEVAAAAGERFSGNAFSAPFDDPANPAVAWIKRYREEAAANRPAEPQLKPRGSYGANTNGVEDFGGNVWEWTSTCYIRATLGPDTATVEHSTVNCGVHVLEGRHRAYMSNFIRDGKSGGCAVGTPPEHLGFRLVREDTPFPLRSLVMTRISAHLLSFRSSDS
ncbi:MAG: formylglycine-generating enzyme family protein [Mesorhizobium sp.]|uniref:SUMF1/EgtB/PvdO family nonheme iron enzyme n=1 Tax=unclassified Mesorhizobium TaxID=325217 RepID=UPI000FCA1EC2|nr:MULTISPECIES: SUMF1/EgtB/PvdO family nonheme iron enzyme [unclassified Mesorhizobium]RUV73235.1 formylglycine-generating enzyme family protein [Mesorhizobium sp. M5C.F.Cr.IN.023.01.1.1]RWF86658.1 MAG: formylglycine-generating enzyme family protein [Mesorhizobium sp.]RWF95381.1 MAG: formylglycine-generating enzyme family protein [Mesorhizobium sp.]RWI39781.1 MAG: formylglycine-generating enzyme family protein [Mesorhizobium sp.]RWI45353.1 MAG: formylglycine-generating enzyme family protein [